MKKIRILIADDHAVVRRGLALVLKQEPDFEIVGEAHDGQDAYNRIFDLVPDIALLDYKMPHWDGFTAAKQIRRDMASVRVIILSGAPLEDEIFDRLDDVHGYVHKEISPANLARAIRAVASGERYFDPSITQALLKQRTTSSKKAVSLSPRELEVLQLMATPATYRDIAEELIVAESTVHTYVRRILKKLDQPNRTQAVLFANRSGLLM